MPKPKELQAQMKKIIGGAKSSEEGFNGLIDLIGTENWEAKLIAFKKEVDEKRSMDKMPNASIKEIIKILNKYNDDFSKTILKSIKEKVKEMEEFGVLSNFRSNSI